MELRKLEREEHNITRALWESVFAEDTEAFLDYYYQIKTRDNEVYVIDEDEKIRAMLQLNPYRVQIEDRKFHLHYIIAVATEAKYRGRGMMRKLLLQAMEAMYRKKEPFTFLMPAAEAIYLPYDFRFVYNQIQMKLTGKECDSKYEVRDAKEVDAGKLAAFSRKLISGSYQVYAIHSKAYYETMLLEQRSEHGNVKMVYCGRKLVGIFAYDKEEELSIREPLFLDGYEEAFLQAVYEMVEDESKEVQCIGMMKGLQEAIEKCGRKKSSTVEERPMIMARILHLDTFLRTLKTVDQQPLQCSFAMIDPLLVQNNRIVKMQYRPDLDEMLVRDTEDSDGVLTIDAFTSFVFGYRTIADIAKDDGVILTEKLIEELKKIKLLKHVFLNEIV
ncbi:MAG: GNAT family N-acetyltransferase [Hespellia sp.]|nr:GNAT family N-acetyltransferase [Hespellia sp.]